MTDKIMVLVVHYKEKDTAVINQILRPATLEINTNWGEICMPYCGDEDDVAEPLQQLLEARRG